MASLRCYGDSDCKKTQIIRKFHLYIIQLRYFFPCLYSRRHSWRSNLGGIPLKKSSRATLNSERHFSRAAIACSISSFLVSFFFLEVLYFRDFSLTFILTISHSKLGFTVSSCTYSALVWFIINFIQLTYSMSFKKEVLSFQKPCPLLQRDL